MVTIHSTIHQAENRWPQLRFKKKTANEASAACPFCMTGIDRFLVFADGGYYCRQCEAKGWIDEEDSDWNKLDPTERRLRLIEAEQRRARQEREESARQISALQRMAECQDYLHYHDALTWEAIDYWHSEGMTNETIDQNKLGFCPRCPTDRLGRPSYTIPVFGRDGTTLVNIRHRLIGDGDGGKYRPHVSGLPVMLFNAKYTKQPKDSIIVAEGEKKSLVLEQHAFPNVGLMGQRAFKRKWLEWLEPFPIVYVALDPDAKDSAERLAAMFEGRGRVVDLPVKSDDFFTVYGGTQDDFGWFVGRARPIKSD